jgi:NitT/TauT family transport system substrate-binding protein
VSKVIAVGAVLSAVSFLAACGGGSSSSSTAASADPAASGAASEAAPVELAKVGFVMPWVIQGEEAGQFAALNQGFYKEEGLDVEIIPGGPDVRAGALLASNSAQFAVFNPAGIYSNRAEGIPVVGIGGINQADGLFLMCKTTTNIKSFADLKGKKVGVWLGGGEAGIQAAAVKSGLAVADVEWLPQKFSMDEFFNDAFDCASATEWNEKHVVYKEGLEPSKGNVVELRPSDVGLFLPGDSIATLESTLQEHPEWAQGIVNGTLRGWQWTCSSPENRKTAAQYVLDAAPDLDLDLQIIQVDEMCSLMAQGPAKDSGEIGGMAQTSWQQSADAALAAGQLKEPADVASAFTPTILDAVPADYRTITW